MPPIGVWDVRVDAPIPPKEPDDIPGGSQLTSQTLPAERKLCECAISRMYVLLTFPSPSYGGLKGKLRRNAKERYFNGVEQNGNRSRDRRLSGVGSEAKSEGDRAGFA